MNSLIGRVRKLINSQQNTVLSAATLIMVMIIASRILGLLRQRVLANYFDPGELSLFFAAFRLPDSIFEVLVFGTFSSAFIPVFSKTLKEGPARAWRLAGKVVAIGLVIFLVAVAVFGVGAFKIYSVIAPGYSNEETLKIAFLARILFAAQGLFVVSYVLTGVLESLRRFLIPALAPIFYNLGIIFGTIVLTPYFGLTGPVIGVLIGALAHLLIQYPLSRKLGFRFTLDISPDPDVKQIGKLALPRVVDLAFDQVGKSAELFLASIISKGAYAYYTFANTLQLLPVTLFGTSLAKAVLPMLSSADGDKKEYRRILLIAIYQAIFFTLPLAATLIVLRIPIVRLVYGTHIFDWEATVQTGTILSVFAISVVFQTLMSILARAFFALHDTKTPVKVSFLGLGLLVIGDFVLIKMFNLNVWALAASFAFSTFIEAVILLFLIDKKIKHVLTLKFFIRIFKILFASIVSGLSMYFLLKFFDKSVWVKRLSFLGKFDIAENFPFQKFVLDTRYTLNLFILSVMVFLIGMIIYFAIAYIFKIEELSSILRLFKVTFAKKPSSEIPQSLPKEDDPLLPN